MDDTKLRTTGLHISYEILSTMPTSDSLAPSLMQLLFWVRTWISRWLETGKANSLAVFFGFYTQILGENAYLSTKVSETSVLELLQRYIMLVKGK